MLLGIEEKAPYFGRNPFPNVTPAWIEARVKDHTIPPVDCEVHDLTKLLAEVRGIAGANAFGVTVPRTRHLCAHVTTSGISKIRVGKECRPYFTTADDDRTRSIVQGVDASDLSLTSIHWAIDRHRTAFQTREAFVDPFEFLATAHLVEPYLVDGEQTLRYKLTLAAVILFGKQSVIQQVLPSFETVFIAYGHHRTIRKNVIESIQELIFSNSSSITASCPQLPVDTARELLVNAYIHRCWRTAAPVFIRITPSEVEFVNPGDLLPGLHPSTLLHCIPAYRNFLLAEGARFSHLCDKIGKGIDTVFESVLSGGLDFPLFESADNRFVARVSLQRCEEFGEFVRRRSASLSTVDEILVLRLLWNDTQVATSTIASALGRDTNATMRVLVQMEKKLMIEPLDAAREAFRLSSAIRYDISNVFRENQMNLDLFGN